MTEETLASLPYGSIHPELLEKYEIESILGAGGFGVVFKAKERTIKFDGSDSNKASTSTTPSKERSVAIKIMLKSQVVGPLIKHDLYEKPIPTEAWVSVSCFFNSRTNPGYD